MTTHYDRETLIDYLHGALTPQADAAVFAVASQSTQTCAKKSRPGGLLSVSVCV